MKVAVLILAVAVVGAFAQDAVTTGRPPFVCDSDNAFVCTFKKLAYDAKYHLTKLGGKLKDVGTSVLNAALGQGSDLLANGAQAVMGTVLEHLNKEGLVGKRATLLEHAKEHFGDGVAKLKAIKTKLHAAFDKAVEKLTGKIHDHTTLQKVDADADKQIDDAVDEFNKAGKKGFFEMAKTIAGKMKDIFTAGMAKLKEKYGKKDEARAVLGFNSLADAWNAAKGHLSNLAGGIADTFKPHMDALKSGIAALGAKAKEHAGNLVDAAKGHFNALKDKLSGHIDTLKGHAATLGSHAVNAVSALKDAVTAIAQQALTNAGDTVKDAVKTGTDAAGVIAGHVGDALGGN